MPPRDEKIQVDQRKFEPGLATIPAQAYRKALKSGFRFNLMAIGEPSLGKTSTVNTIFKSEIYNEQFVSSTQRIANSDSLIVQEFDLKLKENGVPLILRVIDCPGYGAFIDNSNQVPTIVSYLDGRHRRQFDQEMDIDRDIEKNDDELVHCCLFFFSPNCRTVKELDLECLKAIHNKVNVIPIIAKADSLTLDERHDVSLFDEEKKEEPESKPVAMRRYTFGACEIENDEHSDMRILRHLMIQTHLVDLVNSTKNEKYGNFREHWLTKHPIKFPEKKPETTEELKKRLDKELKDEIMGHKEKLQRIQADMEAVFQKKLQERRMKIAEGERKLEEMQKAHREHMKDEENVIAIKRK
ncbi:Oidioi.mRNA.OKI2018_I69.chr1.g664.t2.cds [Oikopleura dioica]|uniref:Oidioi.mRNA.OKI2018_I69.chr1.g664.t2.cds n=1 Tax=Oikopleura dioica TaxID=34765 RepID=A0ABN7SQJ5_OIKDI|nr:Oidioi.mRNA.OKI2018_I69.chr1.g664.t2.cds [Oikopleura dioica]